MKKILYFLAVVVMITLPIVLFYAIVQQTLRQGANFPQTEIVQKSIVPEKSVEISQSLEPFVQIYDQNKNLTEGNALLRGKIPTIPKGALDYAKTHGENRLTWQPETGVRIALVISYQKNTYIVAGRSLREVENQIDAVGKLCFALWLGIIFSMIIFYYFSARKNRQPI